MKKILVLAAIISLPFSDCFAALNENSAIVVFGFNLDGNAGIEPYGDLNCDIDYCYDNSSHACYYFAEADCPGNTSLDHACETYDSNKNLQVIYRGAIPIGCGCLGAATETWRAAGTGREQKYETKPTDCDGNSLTSATNQYRCAAGYYGNGTTCTRCPGAKNSGGAMVYGNSPTGATRVSQCTLPAGNYSDGTGAFTISAPCAHD